MATYFTTRELIDHLQVTWHHLDYGDVIYDQPPNPLFANEVESLEYNVALAMTGAIKGFPCDNCIKNWFLSIYTKEDGWCDCVCSINSFQRSNYHIFITYLHKWKTPINKLTLSMHFFLELNTSKISFLYVSNECNKLDPDIPSSSIYSTMLTFVRSVEKKT